MAKMKTYEAPTHWSPWHCVLVLSPLALFVVGLLTR